MSDVIEVPANDEAARAALDGTADERLADVLAFNAGAFVREAESRRAAMSSEEKRRAAIAAARNRRLAARALIGERAPAWLGELVGKRGADFFEKTPDGAVLKIATRLAFGEERADAIATLTRYLLDKGVAHLVALVLVGAWVTNYAGPVPNEEEILEVFARVAREQKRARGRG